MKQQAYLWTLCLVSAMGGLLFGYDWVVIGGAKIFYEPFFGLGGAASLRGWAMSCALVGCLAGALLSGAWSDRYGRKRMLLLAALLFTVSAVGTGVANRFGWFVVARIVGGLGIGIASNVSPVYIAEVTPARLRGRFVSINQLTTVLGILLAQVVNWRIGEHFTGAAGGALTPESVEWAWWPLTMHCARHCWASIAKSKNIPLSVISEGMGHDSEETTRIYLASLDTNVVDKANSLILKDL